jgi:hypothetical protein
MGAALWIGWVGLLLLFLYSALLSIRNQSQSGLDVRELVDAFLPVDVEAFSRLMKSHDDAESELRIELMLDSLRRMSHNAALLQRLGYTQINSSNQLIGELAQEMIDAGVYVRLYTFVAVVVLRACKLFRVEPRNLLSATRIAELQHMMSSSLIPAYERLKDRAGNLSCLRFSGYHEALVQGL